MAINRHNTSATCGFSASFLRDLAERKVYIVGLQYCPGEYGGYTAYKLNDGTIVTIDKLLRMAGRRVALGSC